MCKRMDSNNGEFEEDPEMQLDIHRESREVGVIVQPERENVGSDDDQNTVLKAIMGNPDDQDRAQKEPAQEEILGWLQMLNGKMDNQKRELVNQMSQLRENMKEEMSIQVNQFMENMNNLMEGLEDRQRRQMKRKTKQVSDQAEKLSSYMNSVNSSLNDKVNSLESKLNDKMES